MTWLLYGTCPEGPRRGLHQDDRSRPSFGEPYQKSLPALPIGRQGSPQAAQASRSPPTAPSRAWTGHRRVQIQVFRGKRSSVYPGEGRPLGGRWVKTCPAGGYTQSPLPRRTGPAEEPEQGARGYLYPGGWGGWREAIAITDAARLERLPVVESGPRRRRSSPHWHDCCATVKGLTLAPRRRRTSVPVPAACCFLQTLNLMYASSKRLSSLSGTRASTAARRFAPHLAHTSISLGAPTPTSSSTRLYPCTDALEIY